MIIEIISHFLRFFLILVVQVFIVSNINVSPYINPFIYILFIIMLPITVPPWILLLVSFLSGFLMDMFSSTPGMHSAATVFMGFVRHFYLKASLSLEDKESYIEPNIANKGLFWFTIYAATMVFVHHLALFLIEIYSFREILITIQRVIYSSALTLLLIIISQYLFFKVRPKDE